MQFPIQDSCVFQDNISSSLDKRDGENHHQIRELHFPAPENENLRVVSNILSENECNSMINQVTINGLSAPHMFDKKVRDCQRRHTVDVGMSDNLFPRIRPFIPECVVIDGARWKLNRFTHHWRFVRYESGGKFIPHWDGSKLLPSHEMTLFTVQFYLNDTFEGGATRFYLSHEEVRKFPHDISYGQSQKVGVSTQDVSVSVQPKQGSALIFNHANESLLHDGEAVKSGVKYILRSDLLYSVVKEEIPMLLSTIEEKTLRNEVPIWCPNTAARYGTKNYVGEVWVCWCAVDRTGTDAETQADQSIADGIAGISGEDEDGSEHPPTAPPRRRRSIPSCAVCLACIDPASLLELDEPSNFNLSMEEQYPLENIPSLEPPILSEPDSGSIESMALSSIVQSTSKKAEEQCGCDESRAGPRLILLSGKRASGKDFIGDRLAEMIREKGIRVHKTALGNINKKIFAKEMRLDYNRLLNDREYKELHRVTMVASHSLRDKKDHLWCIKAVLEDTQAQAAEVVIISDVRMKTDLDAFLYDNALNHLRTCVIATLRINTNDNTRLKRGWKKDDIRDNLPTETNLDTYKNWTSVYDNSEDDDNDDGKNSISSWISNTVFPRAFGI